MAKANTKSRKQKLKVFRTPIGFHDAYVAAPSRKAALEAWGSSTDLFSAGIAEEVKDEKLTKEALERPGEVVRLARGSGKESPERLRKKGGSRIKSGMTKQGRKPSRAALDEAEAALALLEKKQSEERGRLEREEQALARKREALKTKHAKAIERANARRDEAGKRYRSAVAKWER